jgi:phage gpG-like protein
MAANPQAELSFESEQWQKVIKRLDKKWDDIKNRKEFGGIIAASVYKDVMEHFDQEKGPDGKWISWSEAYAAHLQKIGRGGNKILQFSGNLRQRFTPQSWRSKAEGVLFFNNAKTKSGYAYARGHDEGQGKLPKRSFMWLSSKAIDSIIRQTLKWLEEK